MERKNFRKNKNKSSRQQTSKTKSRRQGTGQVGRTSNYSFKVENTCRRKEGGREVGRERERSDRWEVPLQTKPKAAQLRDVSDCPDPTNKRNWACFFQIHYMTAKPSLDPGVGFYRNTSHSVSKVNLVPSFPFSFASRVWTSCSALLGDAFSAYRR